MKKHIILLTIIYIFFSIFYFAKTGNMLIDFSRESYIPYQLLQGKTLVKDIFLIYGGFGYFINCLIYKFSININLIIILSHILAYISTLTFYLIATKLTSKNSALLFAILFITASVFSNSTFSFVLPYSYSTIWAYTAAYIAFYFYINNKQKYLYLILGFIAINRIELFILLFVFFGFAYFFEKKPFKLKNILLSIIFPVLYAITLIAQKISYTDIKINCIYLLKMVNTESIKYLYKSMGAYIQSEYIIKSTYLLLIFALICTISYFLYKKNYKYTSFAIIIIAFIFFNLNNLFNLGVFILFFLILQLKLKNNLEKKELIIAMFSIVLSYKSIFNISPLAYSNFSYIFILFSIYILLKKTVETRWLYITFSIFAIMLTLANLKYYLNHPKYKIKTKMGNIYLTEKDNILFKKINEYIEKNIKNNEKILIVPEGQILNLVHKKGWEFYNSTFTPLDFETFGEQKLIEKLKTNKTNYIIFYPRNTKEYGAQTICYDYGVNFCTYIMDNYHREAIIEEGHKALIFKINDEK